MHPCRRTPCIETLDTSFNHHPNHAVAVVRCNRLALFSAIFTPLESLNKTKMQVFAVFFVNSNTHASTPTHVYSVSTLPPLVVQLFCMFLSVAILRPRQRCYQRCTWLPIRGSTYITRTPDSTCVPECEHDDVWSCCPEDARCGMAAPKICFWSSLPLRSFTPYPKPGLTKQCALNLMMGDPTA